MPNTTPTLSIITPVFNLIKSGRAEFIKQTIESVHNQTYNKYIEHIVQDGNSNDGTLELLKEYEDKGWIKVYSEKDKNVHDAINKAVEHATGKYMAILSSDDYYKDNDIIEDIVLNYLEKEQADYSYGDEERISVKDGTIVDIWKGNAHIFEFWRGNSFDTETMLLKTSVFKEIGKFDIKYAYTADLKLQMQLRLRDYKGVYVPRIIDVFRVGEGLSSNITTLYRHAFEYGEILYELWSQFYKGLTIEKCMCMRKYTDYSEDFLLSLEKFIIDKNLKYFNYNDFDKYIQDQINFYFVKISENNNSKNNGKETPIIIIQNKLKKTYYLFNFLPILKFIENDKQIKYKLFGVFTILRIKKKSK